RYPEIRPLVGNPWTVLHAAAPEKIELAGGAAVDLASEIRDREGHDHGRLHHHFPPVLAALWHGTLLPKSDADLWLATAFADYEAILSTARAPGDEEHSSRGETNERQ